MIRPGGDGTNAGQHGSALGIHAPCGSGLRLPDPHLHRDGTMRRTDFHLLPRINSVRSRLRRMLLRRLKRTVMAPISVPTAEIPSDAVVGLAENGGIGARTMRGPMPDDELPHECLDGHRWTCGRSTCKDKKHEKKCPTHTDITIFAPPGPCACGCGVNVPADRGTYSKRRDEYQRTFVNMSHARAFYKRPPTLKSTDDHVSETGAIESAEKPMSEEKADGQE